MQKILNEIIGQKGITAKVLLDSISNETGQRITTFELTYPRMILAELNTHRVFSRNSASSRAIPFNKMKGQLIAEPVRFGAANTGMQDKGEDFNEFIIDPFSSENLLPNKAWKLAKDDAVAWSEAFYNAGYHKQVYNRLTEPFQMIKTVLTTTEYNNFNWLRNDTAADPSLEELAKCMLAARHSSPIQFLNAGEWHLPYVDVLNSCNGTGQLFYIDENDIGTTNTISLEEAIQVSSARCAAVSFRNTDYGLDKSREVYDRLVGDERKHASALEHQATPILLTKTFIETADLSSLNDPANPHTWQKGISHVDRDGIFWSGNLKNWVQHRKLLTGENYA